MINPAMNQFQYQNPFARVNAGHSINWVQGIEGAKAFTLQPKESIILMDSEADNIFYIKFCDEIGRCTLKRCTYTEEPENTTAQPDMSEYVKKSELESLLNQMLGGKNE